MGRVVVDLPTPNRGVSVWQDRSDGALETQLFLKQARRDSFRTYTLVAENSVAARTQQVALVQSESSPLRRS